MSWRHDLNCSVAAIEKNRHHIEDLLNCKIHRIETIEDKLFLLFDQVAGFDYVADFNSTMLFGVATRVQWGAAYNTFTIRSNRHSGSQTELAKRMLQISKGALFPKYTLQMYCDNRENNNLMSIGVCRTKELYDYVSNGMYYQTRSTSNADFLVIDWTTYSQAGFDIKIKQ